MVEKEEPKPLRQEVDELKEIVYSGKVRKLKLPSKAKVKRGRLKKGWIGIMRVGENRNVSFEKIQIEGSCYRTKDGTYHTTNGKEILFWNGKFPFLVQEDKKVNPKNFTFNEGENETYGQKKIIATILKDTIKVKKGGNMGVIVIIIVIAVIGYVLGKYVFKWF